MMTKEERRRITRLCKARMKKWRAENPEQADRCVGWSFAFDLPIFETNGQKHVVPYPGGGVAA